MVAKIQAPTQHFVSQNMTNLLLSKECVSREATLSSAKVIPGIDIFFWFASRLLQILSSEDSHHFWKLLLQV